MFAEYEFCRVCHLQFALQIFIEFAICSPNVEMTAMHCLDSTKVFATEYAIGNYEFYRLESEVEAAFFAAHCTHFSSFTTAVDRIESHGRCK